MVTERLMAFGEAGVVPLGHSIKSEEGDYLNHRFGSSVRKYQALGELTSANQDVPLREMCDRVDKTERARHRWIVEQAQGRAAQ